MNDPSAAAYGGPGWSPRTTSLAEELGGLWGNFSVASESATLGAVLLHKPGPELAEQKDPNAVQMLSLPNQELLGQQHDAIANAYRKEGVEVHYVDPLVVPSPNQMFVADLMFMTPSGAILGRPASTVRAGEERWVARRLADLGIPILRSVGGHGTFEGADAMWLNSNTVLIGRGLRTNLDGAAQVAEAVQELGVTPLLVDLPHTAMHLMGSVRIIDSDLTFVRSGGVPWTAIEVMRDMGFEVRLFPSEDEIRNQLAHNFVTIAPRKILMPAGGSATQQALNDAGVTTITVEVDEITKAAGAIGCLTGILAREADSC